MATSVALAVVGSGLALFMFLQVEQLAVDTIIPLAACQDITANGSYQITTPLVVSHGTCEGGPTPGVSCLTDTECGGVACYYPTCFAVHGNVTNVSIDGNNQTITTGGRAVDITDLGTSTPSETGTPSGVTVSNFTTAGGVRVYGNNINHITLQGLRAGSISVIGSDDVTIQNNVVGAGGVQVNDGDKIGWNPFRPIISGNTITGGSTQVKILMEIWGDNIHPCPRLDAQVTNNTITNTRNDPPPEATAAVRIRCATHTIFTGNTIRSTGTTIGLYLRDESDKGQYLNNTFWTNGQETIRLASGNVDKTYPAYNLFWNNIFRSDAGPSMFFQGVGPGNLFGYNVFWTALHGQEIFGGQGNTFDHNTFYVNNSGESAMYFDYDWTPADTWSNNIIDHSGTNLFGFDNWAFNRYTGANNLFYNRSGPVAFSAYGPLASWRTASGGTDDLQSREGNPLLTNPALGDFSLLAGSPARGGGTSGSDMGARPYGAAVPAPPAWPPATACSENWTCAGWGACLNNVQTRTCTDQNSCGTTSNRPALSQSCTANTPVLSCATASPSCYSCQYGSTKYNRILAPTGGTYPGGTCTTTAPAPSQCDGTNAVEDVQLSSASLTSGTPLTVTIKYACYQSGTYNSDDLTLWRYNGTSWSRLKTWYANNLTGDATNSLPGCAAGAPPAGGQDGTVTYTFTPSASATTQYVRAFEDSGATTSASTPCPASQSWGNIDDMAFTVASGGGGGGGPLKLPL